VVQLSAGTGRRLLPPRGGDRLRHLAPGIRVAVTYGARLHGEERPDQSPAGSSRRVVRLTDAGLTMASVSLGQRPPYLDR